VRDSQCEYDGVLSKLTRTAGLRIAGAVTLIFALAPTDANQAPATRWYRGNLHTHTLNSDGDSSPEFVARWYKDHGYQFLLLSDHNVFTDPAPLNAALGESEKFLLLAGEEVTSQYQSRPAHVNAYGLKELVKPRNGTDMVSTLQNNIDAIREIGGLPSVNHPNFRWAMTSADLLRLKNLSLFEVYNGHPQVHNLGGGGAESLDEMWDKLLTAGRRIYGIAVDDAHVFQRVGKDLSNPGRGWIHVRAKRLNSDDILASLESGDFYSSTGVELEDVQATSKELRITIRPARDTKYTTEFIGSNGAVLTAQHGLSAVYPFRGGERYVRALVRASNGDSAWTQPVFPR
jgi:predicted metal-dependent phosphoesterase TrpH